MMITKSRIYWLALISFLGGMYLGIAGADTPTIADPEAYRVTKLMATNTFLDPSKSKADRLDAATKLGYPETETFVKLLQIGTNTSEDDDIRLVALKRYRYDDKYIDAVLTIIADPANGGAKLSAGLIEDISRRTTFRQPAKVRQRLQTALRARLNDSHKLVRLAAYQSLVSSHDVMAINRLVESLRRGSEVPIPLPDAIELLDVDGPAKHIVTLRPYLNNLDPAVQAQAARALAVDPDSREAIINLASSLKTPQTVRINALRALAREDENFMKYGIKMMLNRNDTPEIRYTVMKVAAGRMNYYDVPASSQITFAEAVNRLASEQGLKSAEGKDVGVEAKKLFDYLRRSFSVVKKHYDLQ